MQVRCPLNNIAEDLSLLLGVKLPQKNWVQFADVLNPTGRPDRITLIKMVMSLGEHIHQIEDKETKPSRTLSSNTGETTILSIPTPPVITNDAKELVKQKRIAALTKAREVKKAKHESLLTPTKDRTPS